MTLSNIVSVQHAIEQQALVEGRERFFKSLDRLQVEKGYSSSKAASGLTKGCLSATSRQIAKYLAEADNGGRGKTPLAISLTRGMDPDLLAMIALSKALDGLVDMASCAKVAQAIGQQVEDELLAKAMADADAKEAGKATRKATKRYASADRRRKAVKDAAKQLGVEDAEWSPEQCVNVGHPLLDCVLIACPEVFETALVGSGAAKDRDRRVALTPEASAYITELVEAESWMHPMFPPMVTPPRPWVSFHTGAYLDRKVARRVPLVRTRDKAHKERVKAAIADGSMQPCLDALNAIQSVPLRINTDVLEVVKWAWAEGKAMPDCGFPRKDYLPVPPKPDNWEALTERQQKRWCIKAAKLSARNRGIDGERVTMHRDLTTAERYAQHEEFYLPHNLDFRGRVYPVPHFSHHRSDHVKAMIEFAGGKRLGATGGYWLAVHLANCGDFDKVSKKPLDARVDWVVRNRLMIERVAADPIGTFDLWSLADAPFSFVAACIEMAGAWEEGEDFISHIPLALDGSNSGLQHYSAILRDEEGGRLVNLTALDAPQDVYEAVAEVVRAQVERDAAAGDPVASLWKCYGVSRKVVKRNVMTFAYSSETYGFKQQQLDDTMTPLTDKVDAGELAAHPLETMRDKDGELEGDEGFAAAGYIAKAVWAGVNEVVRRAGEGMRFFQKVAAVAAHEAQGLVWRTPVGLPVSHRYTAWEQKRVKMYLYDKAVPVIEAGADDKVVDGDKVLVQVRSIINTKPLDRINKDKAKSAVAPNIIHSLDAAHLMLTTLKAREEGITYVSLIHDSFATHAADTDAFFWLIRDAFVEMYQQYDPFAVVLDSAKATLSPEGHERLPEVPQRGQLDLSEIARSLYAFA